VTEPAPETRFSDRLRRISSLAQESGADAALITNLPDVRWSCGFSGSNGLIFVSAAESVFVTDARYADQARVEVAADDSRIADGNLIQALQNEKPGRLIYQADHVTVQQADTLAEVFEETELMGSTGLFDTARGRKQPWEIDLIRQALSISESVLSDIPRVIRSGMTERELAAEIDYRQRRKGADGPAFDTIVAFSQNAALPHAQPGDRALVPGDSILIDTGCRVGGFASDITRNLYFGTPAESYQNVFRIVSDSVEASISAAKGGMAARDLDAAGRKEIAKAGYGEQFLHSLGHGVGHEIHEWPRISSSSDAVLQPGAVVTIEPGIYLSGLFGIRIEELIVIRPEGCDRLNQLSTELIVVPA